MADLKKRITSLTEKTTLTSGDFIAVDNASGGTKKYNYYADKTALDQAVSDIAEIETEIAVLDNPEGMTVGNAEQLLSDVYTEDKVPYKYRASFSGDREFDEIVGGTVAWNQRFPTQSVNYTGTNFTITSNNDGKFTITTTATVNGESGNVTSLFASTFTANHVYAWLGSKSNIAINLKAYAKQTDTIFKPTSENYNNISFAFANVPAGTYTIYPQLFDLTQMFGSTIADYILAQEQATAGAGVAIFRKMFPASYYAYNAGELISVSGLSAHEMVGLNQWDEEWEIGTLNPSNGAPVTASGAIRSKNFCKCFPNTRYFTKVAEYGQYYLCMFWYDENQTFISRAYTGGMVTVSPANAHYFKFMTNPSGTTYGETYHNDICINLSSDKNGTYEPYQKHSYPLDSSLTLRGIPKLADGKMYFDGDVYASDGTVTRKYGVRAYQSGDTNDGTMITDGTNTVYALTTPTTETAEPFTNPQIVSEYGTEEYVSATICPVGHNTKYPENLRKKIEGLPWDLSMIAPIENGTTASKAYSVGQYFLHNNIFCKAKTSIASGATFTLNTNYEETTVAAELYTALH